MSSLGLQDPPTSFHPILQNQGSADGESVASCGKADCDHAPCQDSRQSRPHATVLAAELNSAFAGTGGSITSTQMQGFIATLRSAMGEAGAAPPTAHRLSASGIQWAAWAQLTARQI